MDWHILHTDDKWYIFYGPHSRSLSLLRRLWNWIRRHKQERVIGYATKLRDDGLPFWEGWTRGEVPLNKEETSDMPNSQ